MISRGVQGSAQVCTSPAGQGDGVNHATAKLKIVVTELATSAGTSTPPSDAAHTSTTVTAPASPPAATFLSTVTGCSSPVG